MFLRFVTSGALLFCSAQSYAQMDHPAPVAAPNSCEQIAALLKQGIPPLITLTQESWNIDGLRFHEIVLRYLGLSVDPKLSRLGSTEVFSKVFKAHAQIPWKEYIKSDFLPATYQEMEDKAGIQRMHEAAHQLKVFREILDNEQDVASFIEDYVLTSIEIQPEPFRTLMRFDSHRLNLKDYRGPLFQELKNGLGAIFELNAGILLSSLSEQMKQDYTAKNFALLFMDEFEPGNYKRDALRFVKETLRSLGMVPTPVSPLEEVRGYLDAEFLKSLHAERPIDQRTALQLSIPRRLYTGARSTDNPDYVASQQALIDWQRQTTDQIHHEILFIRPNSGVRKDTKDTVAVDLATFNDQIFVNINTVFRELEALSEYSRPLNLLHIIHFGLVERLVLHELSINQPLRSNDLDIHSASLDERFEVYAEIRQSLTEIIKPDVQEDVLLRSSGWGVVKHYEKNLNRLLALHEPVNGLEGTVWTKEIRERYLDNLKFFGDRQPELLEKATALQESLENRLSQVKIKIVKDSIGKTLMQVRFLIDALTSENISDLKKGIHYLSEAQRSTENLQAEKDERKAAEIKAVLKEVLDLRAQALKITVSTNYWEDRLQDSASAKDGSTYGHLHRLLGLIGKLEAIYLRYEQ